MTDYYKEFKEYFKDLSKTTSIYGGGSAVALSFCIGCSLLQKAINYSMASSNLLKLKSVIKILENKKKVIGKIIDLDGAIFKKILVTKGKNKIKYLNKSEKLIKTIAFSCKEILSLANEVESNIKKVILSDFYIGKEFIYLCLVGCVYNLETNSQIFGYQSKNIKDLKVLRDNYGKDFRSK
ncbi:MAG: cyclodeaminase/cyclohydrolase family protein [Candidatus Omnitrophica bacterium]|nr:cyclodeaminase/cyclohydrolase family protein [Candidatus Omnitrophota bacterium]MCM8831338.1 cyclodeaminase/cyclohydrolase family protein [Candidatus Omnitrophota bacterium]